MGDYKVFFGIGWQNLKKNYISKLTRISNWCFEQAILGVKHSEPSRVGH